MNSTEHNDPTRRAFLKNTTRLAATSVLAAGAVRGGVHLGEDHTIRLALVGCGGRGTGAVRDAFATTGGPVKLHAVADLFPHRIEGSLTNLTTAFPEKLDVPPERQFIGFDAYKQAIDSLSPGDVVLLTTHAAFRPLHFEYAVQKGINVFAEKSFATDSPAARRWLRAAELSEKKNLKVGVGLMWRHSAGRQEVVKRIHDGAIGDVHTLRIYRVHGPVHCPPRPADKNELEFQLQHPNSFTWVSSGFFIDWHCHNIDVACWVKGAWPVSAQGFGGRCYPEAGNQFDHYTVEYTFADGAKLLTFSRHMKDCWQTYSDYACGSKGSAMIMSSLGRNHPTIYKGQKMAAEEIAWRYEPREPNPYVAEWQALLDAIRADTPHNEARRAGEADLVAIMGRMATHTGQFVTWDQAMNSDFEFVKDIDRMNYDTEAPLHEGPDGLYPAPQPGISKEI